MEILGLDMIKQVNELSEVTDEDIARVMGDDPEITAQLQGLDRCTLLPETDLPKLSTFAVDLLKLVNQVKDLDTNFEQFGSDHHRYEFNPVITVTMVRNFELRHMITLPEEYVEFLTQVGNGGAGPGFGIYSLDELEQHNFAIHSEREVNYGDVRGDQEYYTLPYVRFDVEPMLTSSLTGEKWDRFNQDLAAVKQSGNYDAYRDKLTEAYNGIIEIADHGFGYCSMLVCEGDMAGQIVEFSHNLDMPDYTGKSFSQWLLDHFKAVIRNLDV